MKNEVLLGIDFGKKRVGVAISHGFMAEAYRTLDYSDKEKFLAEIRKIIEEQKIQKLVVGLPVHGDEDTDQTKWTREQAKFISEKLNLPYELVNEAYSSVEADKYLGERDSESARIILEQYLAS